MSEINIVENLTYDEILDNIKSQMQSDIALLESDPATKILEIVAYRELLLRERINSAAKANLLAFAANSDLDYLAEFYGVKRLENESDDIFRNRIRSRISAFSSGGTKDHYIFHALSSSPDVKDALASSSPDNPGLIKISILSNSKDGTCSSELLKTVENYINRDDIKMLTDTIEVVGCKVVPVDIKVEIKTANLLALDSIKESFANKFNKTKSLGWTPSISWIIANLFTDDITHIRVLEPNSDTNIESDECVTLRSLEFI